MYTSINPSNAELISEHKLTTQEDLAIMLTQAEKHRRSWQDLKIEQKLVLVEKLKNLLIENSKSLASEITTEMGKVFKDAQKEVQRMILFCEHALSNAPQILSRKNIPNPLAPATMIYEPLGIIFSITPWNVPMGTPLRSILPALLCGNAVILKPAPNVVGCAKMLVELIKTAGFPEELLCLILVENERAEKLIADNRIKKISFVGSTGAGAHLASIAGKNVKPILLELGGSDPMIVLDDANLEMAIADAASARCNNAGQVCCSSKRMIISAGVYEKFKEGFVALMKAKKTGDPFNDSNDYGPLARKDILERLKAQVNAMKNTNAKVLLDSVPIDSSGYYFSPMVFEDSGSSSFATNEELFGPVATLFKAKDDEDALKIANSSLYGLGSAVYSNSKKRADYVARNLEAGFVYINRPPGLHPYIPFGGVKQSGYGKDCGDEGYYEYVNKKVVVSDLV